MLSLIAEIGCLALAVIIGTIAYGKLNTFMRLLFLQVLVWAAFYSFAHWISWQQMRQHKQIDTQWLMNIHMALETGLLLFAARFIYPESRNKWILFAGGLSFVVAYVVQITISGFQDYLHYADLTECVVISLVFLPVLFASPQGKEGLALRVACVGLLLYFTCSVPYVSLMNYLQLHKPALNSLLYHVISDVLANLRYALIAIAFIIQYRNGNKERQLK